MNRNHNLDLTLVPKELKLVLDILKSAKEEQILLKWKETSKEIDWQLFLQLSVHHRIYPIVSTFLKKYNTYQIIPSFVIEELSLLYKINTFQMLQLGAEMEQVGQLLNQNKIRTLFLKGPALAIDLYGNLSLRTSCDLDLLVPISDLEKTENILLDIGYEKDDYIQTVLGDWKWRHHHLSFHHLEKNIKIEVHWRLNPGPGSEPDFEQLWKRKREIKGSSLYLLGREDLFFFLITHGARHGWSRLRWLLDIKQILEQNLNWEKVHQQLKKYGYLKVGGQAIILASQLLNTNIPLKLEPRVVGRKAQKLSQEAVFYLEKMVELHSETVPDDVAVYHKEYLVSLMSSLQKFLFLISCLHPYPKDAETLPLPKKLHFLYFPLRPFLWILRKARAMHI